MSSLEERLAALEAQNATLQGRIDELEGGASRRGPAPGPSSVDGPVVIDDTVGRRALLRKLGGAAVAGAGLFAASSAVAPTPSLAATDDPVLAGNTTAASTNNVTTLQMGDNFQGSVAPRETLRVVNTGVGPALRVQADGGTAPLTLEVNASGGTFGDTGGLAADGSDTYADLLFFHSGDSSKTSSSAIVGKVLTTNFAQYVDYPNTFPIRSVETRETNKKNHPDGSGPLSGEYTIDISSDLPAGAGGIIGSITCIPQNNAAGFLRFWDTGTQPGTANLAWSGGQIETTSVQTAVTGSGTFKIFVSGTVHLVLDLVAVTKND